MGDWGPAQDAKPEMCLCGGPKLNNKSIKSIPLSPLGCWGLLRLDKLKAWRKRQLWTILDCCESCRTKGVLLNKFAPLFSGLAPTIDLIKTTRECIPTLPRRGGSLDSTTRKLILGCFPLCPVCWERQKHVTELRGPDSQHAEFWQAWVTSFNHDERRSRFTNCKFDQHLLRWN